MLKKNMRIISFILVIVISISSFGGLTATANNVRVSQGATFSKNIYNGSDNSVDPSYFELVSDNQQVASLYDSEETYQYITFLNVTEVDSDNFCVNIQYDCDFAYSKDCFTSIAFLSLNSTDTLDWLAFDDYDTTGIKNKIYSTYFKKTDFENQEYIYIFVGVLPSESEDFSDGVAFKVINPFCPIVAPKNLKMDSHTNSSFQMSWDSVEGATGYNIYSNYDKLNGDTLWVDTSCGIDVYLQNTDFEYTVTAVNDKGESIKSNPIYYNTNIPVAPTSVRAVSSSASSVTISWAGIYGVSGYTIYRSTSSSGSYSYVASTTATSYLNKSLTTGTTYYYKVYAYIMAGGVTKLRGPYSAVVSAIPLPATPTAVKAVSASYNSITVSWAAVSGISGYKIYRATSINGTYVYINSTAATSFTNTSLSCGTYHYYKICSYVLLGSNRLGSNYSAIVYAKPIPSIPSSFSVSRASASSIKLSWGAVAGASGYTIYRSTASNGAYVYVKSTTSTSYINSGLSKNKTYYYKVYAYRMVNGVKVCGNYSAVKSAKTY